MDGVVRSSTRITNKADRTWEWGNWVKYNGHRYCLGSSGAMLTGMQKIGGKVYYLNEERREGVPEGACVVTDGDGAIIFP